MLYAYGKYKLLKQSMEYHFPRYNFCRNKYFYNMFDILLEREINSLRLIENRLEIDRKIIEIDLVE